MKIPPILALVALLAASGSVRADCYDAAAQYHHVNPLILRAISWAETHNQPAVIHRNSNGSTDFGLMQINSVHLQELSRFGVSSETLMQPCANVYIAAWHLHAKMEKYGNTWAAVGAYHSETPALRDRYALRVLQILSDWGLVRQ